MATRFTPINQSERAAELRHIPSRLPEVSPGSPPMSPLSPLPSWFNDEDMECPHTPAMKQSPPMSPLSPLPSWFNDEDMECPNTPIMKQPSSPLASLTSSLLPRLESNHFERSSLSPLLVGQALAPSAVLFPNLPAPALQHSVRSATRKRGSDELGTAEAERGQKVARRSAQKAQKTSTQDEESGLLIPVSNVSGSPQSSTTSKTSHVDKQEVRSN
ncbi:hypothetical protein QBC45DRAFT_410043 [Copromyces sp. CBS 386.78]|nr:hypothetical protein QBC45DRAFT_410043 [Copromyces sp. CBS 386.78]